MKIAIITPYAPPEQGAPSRRADAFRKYFEKQGHIVSLIVPYREGFSGATDKVNKRYKTFQELIQFVRGNDVAIITSPPIKTAFQIAPILKFFNIPFVADNRDLAENAPTHKELRQLMEKCVLKLSNKITGVTGYFPQYYQKYHSISPNKITVVPNGVDTELFYFEKDAKKKIRTEMKIPEKAKILLYQGIMGGHEINPLLELLPNNFLEQYNLYLLFVVIVGDTEEESRKKLDDLKQLLEKKGFTKRTRFVENAPPQELRSYISASDYGISSFPSNKVNLYTIPVKTYEFIACQLPTLGMGPKGGEMEKLMQRDNIGLFSDSWEDLLEQFTDHLKKKKRIVIDKTLAQQFERGRASETMLNLLKEIHRHGR